jgi:thymidylate synthase
MYVIGAINVNHAWPRAIELIEKSGVRTDTRAGQASVVPFPVATVYARPVERVLFDPVRDANPIFHHMEALWMLAGRDDATWLDQFVGDFSKRFAETDGRMHGAYGKRWRDWFVDPLATVGENGKRYDQLDAVVYLLKKNPNDRQAVIQMWDPSADLGVPDLKDRPCNQQIMLRCDRVETSPYDNRGMLNATVQSEKRYLDITVTNRSNDAVFGCYGANVYHMSILHEYLAARIGVKVGTYTQFSNNLHMYDWSRDKVDESSAVENKARVTIHGYPKHRPLVDSPKDFDRDLRFFLNFPSSPKLRELKNSHFDRVAAPMYHANAARKAGDWDRAFGLTSLIDAADLRIATVEWLLRRQAGAAQGKETRE